MAKFKVKLHNFIKDYVFFSQLQSYRAKMVLYHQELESGNKDA